MGKDKEKTICSLLLLSFVLPTAMLRHQTDAVDRGQTMKIVGLKYPFMIIERNKNIYSGSHCVCFPYLSGETKIYRVHSIDYKLSYVFFWIEQLPKNTLKENWKSYRNFSGPTRYLEKKFLIPTTIPRRIHLKIVSNLSLSCPLHSFKELSNRKGFEGWAFEALRILILHILSASEILLII